MKATTRFLALAPLFLAVLLLTSLPLPAQLYLQNFTNVNGSSSNTNSGSVGWSTYFATSTQSTSIVNQTTLSTFSGDYSAITNGLSNPSSAGYGFLAFVTNNSTTGVFGSVTSLGSGISVANGTSINWVMGNNNTQSKIRLLVQVDGFWYASSTTFSNISTNTVSSAATFKDANIVTNTYGLNFSTTAANWTSFTLDPGNATMSLGTQMATDLTSNLLTGIGFYAVDTGTAVVRLDTLQIVPEPTTYALIGLGIAVLGLSLRHRASRYS
ncbi:MAG: hypothetical protein B9S32_17470 [Verrucomicrobia bacterium Tous-C9LFEB]|nr:MAG: hypothetical protein B9S32_17470 [Verrucomicrobia bacterium Tous-C9LFEB]